MAVCARIAFARAAFALAPLLAATLASPAAWTQEVASYPNKPIRMVVGFAAGGGNDLFARLVGQKFSEEQVNFVCPWHGYEYDIKTGECAADRRLRLRKYNVVRRGDEIFVAI